MPGAIMRGSTLLLVVGRAAGQSRAGMECYYEGGCFSNGEIPCGWCAEGSSADTGRVWYCCNPALYYSPAQHCAETEYFADPATGRLPAAHACTRKQEASPPPVSAASGGLKQDPHLHFAHGGRADFRGRHRAIYAFFSAPGLAVNVRTENATFRIHKDRLTVDGSFVTEAHLTARVGRGRREWANVSFWAAELNEWNWGWSVVNGTCVSEALKLGKGGYRT